MEGYLGRHHKDGEDPRRDEKMKESIEDLLIEGGVPEVYVPLGLIALRNALERIVDKNDGNNKMSNL